MIEGLIRTIYLILVLIILFKADKHRREAGEFDFTPPLMLGFYFILLLTLTTMFITGEILLW